MRYANTDQVLQLALDMQGSRLGLSPADIESKFGVSRSTARRMRAAVIRNWPQIERIVDDEQRPRWRIPGGAAGAQARRKCRSGPERRLLLPCPAVRRRP